MRPNATTCSIELIHPFRKSGRRVPLRPHSKPQRKLPEPLKQLVDHLIKRMTSQGYSYSLRCHYLPPIRRFLAHIHSNGRPLSAVTQGELNQYLLNLYPDSSGRWMRKTHGCAINYLMRMIHMNWPPKPVAETEKEKLDELQRHRFEQWMFDVRGLSVNMRRHLSLELKLLQGWCHKNAVAVRKLTLLDVERFIFERSGHLKKTTMAATTSSMRSCLKYLHQVGELETEIAPRLQGPYIYEHQEIVSCPTQDQVEAALRASAADRTPQGLRGRAILLLLTTYGFRSGEILDLTLDDLDWKREVISIRHRKTRRRSEFPLVPDVGEAIVDYLKHARPRCATRRLFIRHLAPYRGLVAATSLRADLCRIFERAGVQRTGKRGAHSLRHYRAVSMLRKGASLKAIGDLLGHSAARSTIKYLKLSTEDLRKVSLELPKELLHV